MSHTIPIPPFYLDKHIWIYKLDFSPHHFQIFKATHLHFELFPIIIQLMTRSVWEEYSLSEVRYLLSVDGDLNSRI